MKTILHRVEKKIVASDRNQPRIYLTKQETQSLDMARPILVTIEQEEYSVVDAEIIEFFNQKLGNYIQQHQDMQVEALEEYIYEIMTLHRFVEVARDQENIAFARDGRHINARCPPRRTEISIPPCGFDEKIDWLMKDAFRFNFKCDDRGLPERKKLESIVNDLLSGGLIISGLVANENGHILVTSRDWNVDPEDLKACLYDWQHNHRRVKLQGIKYSMLFSQPDNFSAVNGDAKKWLVGAATPKNAGEKYYVIGLTASATDGRNAYADVARAANRIIVEGTTVPEKENPETPTPLIKAEYDAMIALETQLGEIIPVVKQVGYDTFGCVISNKHVIALGLNGKKMTTIPDSICNLKFLQGLVLSNTGLIALPEDIGHLKRLTYLNLNSNKLTNLPSSIGDLSMLKDLRLYSNQLTTLPSETGNLVKLETLWVQENKLETIPGTIGQLPALKQLCVDLNQLTSIPSSIGNLMGLQMLTLGENKLSSLPDTIGNLVSLKQLVLSGNEFTMLPETIGNLSSLEELYLVSNRSETFFLPDSIVRLTALKRLDLGQLDVSSFPEGKKNALLALQAKGILDIASLPLNEKRVNVKVMIKQLNERIIKAREGLSQTSWDEDKKNEIMALIQSGEPNILDSPRIREIKYQLVQSGLVFKEINEWRVLDETKHADLALKKGIEIHEKMVNVKDILHPAIKAYFKETIKAKSDAFRKRIPFDYEALE